jgi:hypothetical protein
VGQGAAPDSRYDLVRADHLRDICRPLSSIRLPERSLGKEWGYSTSSPRGATGDVSTWGFSLLPGVCTSVTPCEELPAAAAVG